VPTEILKGSPVSAPQDEARARPKVLHLIDSFDQGGSERQALQLVSLLHREAAYTVHLASLKPDGILREQVESLSLGEIPSYPLTSFYDRNFLVQVRRLAAHLREWDIALVHTHDFYTNIFGMAAAAWAGVPVRIASRRDLGKIRTAAQGWLERRAYSLAQRVIANSEAVRQQLINEGVREKKTAVIYNGLEMNRVLLRPGLHRSEAAAALDLSQAGDRQVVTIVANFRLPTKDQATFLRAAQRVHEERPETLFVLAGEGELQPRMRELAEQLGLKDQACFLGRCDRLAELLTISDVCVLSSKSEGFSNAILEYMAAERPVVATDVGGARESIVEGETGYLVPPGDHAAMASRILMLLRDPAKASAMGRQGRNRVEQYFSPRMQLERTQELYAQLLAGVSGRIKGTSVSLRGDANG